MMSIRDAFGLALAEVGREFPDVVAVSCDLREATRLSYFTKAFPERTFEVGIAEANAVGIATGLALEGFRPFLASFGAFITGKNVEIRTSIAYNQAPVVIVGTHGGMIGPDGGTQSALQDIAVMRSIPGFHVYQPATPNETRAIVRYAAMSTEPTYIRISRNEVREYFDRDCEFYPGTSRTVINPSEALKAIITSGPLLGNCCDAATTVGNTKVINMPSIEPIDADAIIETARSVPSILVVEDHSTKGGLGGAVAEVIAQHVPHYNMTRAGIDNFIMSGRPSELETIYGLNVEGIEEKLRCLYPCTR